MAFALKEHGPFEDEQDELTLYQEIYEQAEQALPPERRAQLTPDVLQRFLEDKWRRQTSR